MSAGLAKYACDECRSRKVKCSRNKPSCMQCTRSSYACIYSRSGIIRRRARRSTRPLVAPPESEDSAATSQPQIVTDIVAVRQGLEKTASTSPLPFHALASLSAEYASFWPGDDVSDRLGPDERKFIAYSGDQATSMTNTYCGILAKGEPFFTPTPPGVLQDLAPRPENITEKARLVIFYGILLTDAYQDDNYNETTCRELRWNLRLALDDARLLLEPSDINIQALVMMATHVQECTSPSLCWMLISSACRMLQALGTNTQTIHHDRRVDLFWSVCALDISLAIIFGRPPTFHRFMYKQWPMMSFERLLSYQPHVDGRADAQSSPTSGTARSLYGAHYSRRTHLLVYILADIWYYLYERSGTVNAVKAKLDSWYKESREVLQATKLAEQPMLDEAAARALQLGLQNLCFQYHYFAVVLIRGEEGWKDDCIEHSCEALLALAGLVSDSTDVFNGIVWQLLFCPFTPFFVLFGDVLSTNDAARRARSLKAMYELPSFLGQMTSRHHQAMNLFEISSGILQYASQYHKGSQQGGQHGQDAQQVFEQSVGSTNSNAESREPDDWASATLSDIQGWDEMLIDSGIQDLPIQGLTELGGQTAGDLGLTLPLGPQDLTNATQGFQPYHFFAQSSFDWLNWESQFEASEAD